jgi:hypothetical protein
MKPDIEELVNTAALEYAARGKWKTPRWWSVCTFNTEVGPIRLFAVPGAEPVVVIDRTQYHRILAALAALGLPEET